MKGLCCFWPQGWVPANLANVVWMQNQSLLTIQPSKEPLYASACSLPIFFINTNTNTNTNTNATTNTNAKKICKPKFADQPPSKEPLYACSLPMYIFHKCKHKCKHKYKYKYTNKIQKKIYKLKFHQRSHSMPAPSNVYFSKIRSQIQIQI